MKNFLIAFALYTFILALIFLGNHITKLYDYDGSDVVTFLTALNTLGCILLRHHLDRKDKQKAAASNPSSYTN